MIKSFPILLVLFFTIYCLPAQTISTFDDFPIGVDTFWNGIDQSGGFTSGNAYFPNEYSTEFGGYWKSGWAVSSVQDSSTSGFGNLYGSKTYSGFQSANYAVGQQNAVIKSTGNAAGKEVSGFYITNTTYAFNSMRDGDQYAKKFGGETGDDPDFFKLSINAFYDGTLKPDSVEFYLADFRFSDNLQDYIVGTWEWVDLTTLGNCDSLRFTLSSSDVGAFGINTPLFFCIDDFTTADLAAISDFQRGYEPEIYVFPNPASEFITIELRNYEIIRNDLFLSILDESGKKWMENEVFGGQVHLSLKNLPKGLYFVVLKNSGEEIIKKVVRL